MQSLRVTQPSLARTATRPHISRRAQAVVPRALPVNVIVELAERTGTVDAGLEVPIIAGIVVALAGTAAIPLLLKPGQEAADKIFDPKDRVTKTSVKDRKRK